MIQFVTFLGWLYTSDLLKASLWITWFTSSKSTNPKPHIKHFCIFPNVLRFWFPVWHYQKKTRASPVFSLLGPETLGIGANASAWMRWDMGRKTWRFLQGTCPSSSWSPSSSDLRYLTFCACAESHTSTFILMIHVITCIHSAVASPGPTVTNCFLVDYVVSDILDLSQVLLIILETCILFWVNPRAFHTGKWRLVLAPSQNYLVDCLSTDPGWGGGPWWTPTYVCNLWIRPRSYKLNGQQKLMPWPILIFSPLRLNNILSQQTTKGIIGQQKMAKDVGRWFSTHTLEG